MGPVGPKGGRAHFLPCAGRGAQGRTDHRHGTVLIVFVLWLIRFDSSLGRLVVSEIVAVSVSCVSAVVSALYYLSSLEAARSRSQVKQILAIRLCRGAVQPEVVAGLSLPWLCLSLGCGDM